MLTPLIAAKIDAALLELELLQRSGAPDVPAPGEPGVLAWLAQRAGVAEGTINNLQRMALAKVARALREETLPPHLSGAFCALIDDPSQPELF